MLRGNGLLVPFEIHHHVRLRRRRGMRAVVASQRKQGVGVVCRGQPVVEPRVAAIQEKGRKRGNLRVGGIEIEPREEQEGRVRHARGGRGRKQLAGTGAVARADEGPGQPGTVQRRQRRTAVEPVEHAVHVRRAGEGQRMAGIDARRLVRGHRPPAKVALDLHDPVAGNVEPRPARLDEEMRGPEGDVAVPRRRGAVGPHREVVRMHHRADAADSGRDGPPRVMGGGSVRHRQRVQDPARRNQREDA